MLFDMRSKYTLNYKIKTRKTNEYRVYTSELISEATSKH